MMPRGNATMEVCLEEVRFHAFHGMLPQEKKVGNEFEVDVKACYSTTPPKEVKEDGKPGTSADNDSLKDSLCYAELYEVVKVEMQTPSATLEYVARRIGEAVLHRWPHLEGVRVSVCKLAPPIPNFRGQARVTWSYSRQ